MSYVVIPRELRINEVKQKKFSLSPALYKRVNNRNTNLTSIEELLEMNPISGKEVGSNAYVPIPSGYRFIRTKAITSDAYLTEYDIQGAFAWIKPADYIDNIGLRAIRNGDILFVTGGNVGEVAIADKALSDLPSSHIRKLIFSSDRKYYIFAFLKSAFCKAQANIGPIGAIKGLDTFSDKTLLRITIPFPTQSNSKAIIKYVDSLVKSVINKEREIRRKHKLILNTIETELRANQAVDSVPYEYPTRTEINELGRMDTGLYTTGFKTWNYKARNYHYGSKNIISQGFKWARGTSLEIKGIGTRIDSYTAKESFYQLIIPTNISVYGTIKESSFIGTPKALKTLRKGDIVFGGEGFEKGRSFVVIDESSNVATNYHGIRIYKDNPVLTESIFVRCFLAFWREKGMIDYIGVGGSGGHCAPKYFPLIEIPNFPISKQVEVSRLYHNPEHLYPQGTDFETFLEEDDNWNTQAGILELDSTGKKIKSQLDNVIQQIVMDEAVEADYSFLNSSPPSIY